MIGKMMRCCIIFSKILLFMISTFFLTTFLFLDTSNSDPRIQSLKLIRENHIPNYMRSVQLPNNLRHFVLSEITNDNSPKLFGEEIFLIINTRQHQGNQYLNLLPFFQKAEENQIKVPVYVLRNKHIFMMGQSQVVQYVQEIQQVILYYTTVLGTKKLTLLSFQQSALLCFRTLAALTTSVFPSINKVIFINLFNMSFKFYQPDPESFIEHTKSIIMRNSSLISCFNDLRIVVIRTKQIPYPKFPNQQPFELEFNGKILKNYVSFSTRFMWNVYTQLGTDEYFRFQPFLWIITKFIYEDRKKTLTPQEIKYLFTYKETNNPIIMLSVKKDKILQKCVDKAMPIQYYKEKTIKQQCTRVVMNHQSYQIDESVLLWSKRPFQVYGEEYEKIQPIETKLATIFIINNLNNFKCLYVINPKYTQISLSFAKEYEPEGNPLVDPYAYADGLFGLQDIPRICIIKVCPEYRLLFPIHFKQYGNLQRQIRMMTSEDKCYSDSDGYKFYWGDFVSNWKLEQNLIVFTLLCSHVTQTSIFSRLYRQLIINYVLNYCIAQNILVIENLLIISMSIALEILFFVMVKISYGIGIPEKYLNLMLIIPILIQISRFIFILPSFVAPWKLLNIMLVISLKNDNVRVLFIHSYFLVDYLILGANSHSLGLILGIVWMICNSYKPITQTHKMIANSIDVVYLAIMGACIDQSSSVIRQVINFYLISHILLTFRRVFLKYTDSVQ